MDYQFFEKLTEGEARQYLQRYVEVEARETAIMVEEARCEGVTADFSIDSITGFYDWLRPKILVHQTRPPGDTPRWLRKSMEEHHGGFLDFDDASRLLVLRASYYFGQSFAEAESRLRWSIGRAGRADFNQPVVTGFRTDADLPPLIVAENLLLSAGDTSFVDRVRTAVATWRNAI